MPVNFVAKIILLIAAVISILLPRQEAVKIVNIILLAFTLYVACFRREK